MPDAHPSDGAVFQKHGRTVLKQALVGLVLLVLLVGLFWFRDSVATELAPTVARVPAVSVQLGALLLEWLLVALLVLAGPLFLASTVFMLYRYANPVPALVVDADGFTDDVSLTNLGRVEWSAVSSIAFVEQAGVPQLQFRFEDPDRVLGNLGGVKGTYLEFNRRVMSGDGAVPVHQLDAEVDEIIETVEHYSGLSVDR